MCIEEIMHLKQMPLPRRMTSELYFIVWQIVISDQCGSTGGKGKPHTYLMCDANGASWFTKSSYSRIAEVYARCHIFHPCHDVSYAT